MQLCKKRLTQKIERGVLVVFMVSMLVALMISDSVNAYSKGDCIFRLTDEDGDLERSEADGWTPGHVGIWSGSGNGIWEAAKTHCYSKSEGWVTVDKVLLTNYNDYAWQEWEMVRSTSILESSEAFLDSHFDYRDEVRDAIVAYAAAQDGEPYNPPFGWYCTKLAHYAYKNAVTNYPADHEADYIGRPEKVMNLQSSSHSVGTWSNDDTVDFTWTTACDFGSVKDELSHLPYVTPITVYPLFTYDPPVSDKGIDGYSIVWDHNPDTLPDVDLLDPYDTDDGSATSITCTCPSDGIYYFHIRSLDVTSNYGDEAAHLGPFCIGTKADLSASLSADSPVNSGDTFTVTMTVSNAVGSATANNVAPSSLSVNTLPPGDASATCGGHSPTSTNIPGGSSQDFTWTCTASGEEGGTLELSASASGTDACSGETVTASSTTSNTVTVEVPEFLFGLLIPLMSSVLIYFTMRGRIKKR
jgi:hypothetical protein